MDGPRLFFLFFPLFSPLVYVFFSLSKVTRMIGVPLLSKQSSFLIFFFFSTFFFSLSKVTRMIGVPLVAKQGSFVIFFGFAALFFPSVHTQLFTIELFTMDL